MECRPKTEKETSHEKLGIYNNIFITASSVVVFESMCIVALIYYETYKKRNMTLLLHVRTQSFDLLGCVVNFLRG